MTLQELVWVASIVGGISAVTQLVIGHFRQRNESKWKQAEMGYRLLDNMFDDPGASAILTKLDETARVAADSLRRGGDATHEFLDDDWDLFERALNSFPDASDVKVSAAQHDFDCLLYYFNRFHHAVKHKLTTIDSLKTPTAYYVVHLAKHKAGLISYAKAVGYPDAISFLRHFPEWNVA